MSDTGGFVAIALLGLVLFRPRDVPFIARSAGRAAGISVRGLRRLRRALEKVVAEGQRSADGNADLRGIREQLSSSLAQFDSLASTVRRDMAEVPLSPAALMRRARSQVSIAPRPGPANYVGDVSGSKPSTASMPTIPPLMTSPVGSPNGQPPMPFTNRSSEPLSINQGAAGADVIARSIEEGALAEKQAHIFGSAQVQSEDPRSQ